MDIVTARTLLQVVETGSFKAASDRLNVTQSTVSSRIKTLEEELGRRLLNRSKAGISLTPAGEQFLRHAEAIVRIWRRAQIEVARATRHDGHIAIGGQISLWDGLLLSWIQEMRAAVPDVALTAEVGDSQLLIERLSEGTLDVAVVYRGAQRPGLYVEHLCDDELVMVSRRRTAVANVEDRYVFVNWGPEFAADHGQTYAELSDCGLHLNLGAIGISLLMDSDIVAYFPLRLVKQQVADGHLFPVSRARRFVYPVYAVYSDEASGSALTPQLLELLREIAAGR